jgi:hypothetical protein
MLLFMCILLSYCLANNKKTINQQYHERKKNNKKGLNERQDDTKKKEYRSRTQVTQIHTTVARLYVYFSRFLYVRKAMF